jgi:hypothetical protein
MDQVIPWSAILGLIEPHYPRAGNGTQPMPMQRMLRIYFMQQWFNLSDPAMEDSLYDSESMRRFAQIELQDDAVPVPDPRLKVTKMIWVDFHFDGIGGSAIGLLRESFSGVSAIEAALRGSL